MQTATRPMFDTHPDVRFLNTEYCPKCEHPVKVDFVPDFQAMYHPVFYHMTSGDLLTCCPSCGETLDRAALDRMG